MLVPPPVSTLEQHMSNSSLTEAQKGQCDRFLTLYMCLKNKKQPVVKLQLYVKC